MALYTVAGLTQQIELPVPLIIDLLPIKRNTRSGAARQLPGYWVQHETGNPRPGADAEMHNRYLHNIPDGTFVSFHFAVDDGVIYQMVPVDEVTWQAADGAGPGNMSGISCELCINAGINTAKARNNAEALAGGIMKALGMGVDRVKRHWDFNEGTIDRHHCPDQMMNENYWPTFVANVGKIISPAPPVPQYPTPLPLPKEMFPLVAEVLSIKTVVPRQYAESDAPKSGPNIPVNTKVKIIGEAKNKEKQQWFFLEDHSRVRASSFTPAITVKPR